MIGSLLIDGYIALRSALRQGRRSALGVSAVSFGVISMILAAGFINWVLYATREYTINSGLGHIRVVRSGYLVHGVAAPFDYILPDKTRDLDRIRTLPDVNKVAPRLMFNGLISLGEATLSFLGEGMDPDQESSVQDASVIVVGNWPAREKPYDIVIGMGLAKNLGAKLGDRLILTAETRTGGINAVEVTVSGMFATISKAYDDSAIRVPLQTAQELLHVAGAHVWVVFLKDTEQTSAVETALRRNLSDPQLETYTWVHFADLYQKSVTLFKRQVLVVQIIIAVIIALSISNTMTMNVMERIEEIGTSMALGVQRKRLLTRFLIEGTAVGIFGGVIGVLAGVALAHLISAVGIPMPPPPGMSKGYSGEILVSGQLVLDSIVLSLGTAFVASIYPAWMASRLAVVDALRSNR